MSITKTLFDNYNGRDVHLFTLKGDKISVGVLDFGATVHFIKLDAHKGEINACLGFDSVEGYLATSSYCGATVGRVANRIAKSRFTLDGKEYVLSSNEGETCLHGGKDGFNRRIFDSEIKGDKLVLSLTSPDGDMGFPGEMKFRAEFELDGKALVINYYATSDKRTPFSPTCHAYFNLGGGGEVLDTVLKINADRYTPTDGKLIPLGAEQSVIGTPLDFTSPKKIREDYSKLDIGTYDHNFCLNGANAVTAFNEKSGVTLDVSTDLPGVQLYVGKPTTSVGNGGGYGFCLEPQFFPNAVNVPAFASPVIEGGKEVRHYVKYSFGF